MFGQLWSNLKIPATIRSTHQKNLRKFGQLWSVNSQRLHRPTQHSMDNPILTVSPTELYFLPPFEKALPNTLQLSNTSTTPVAYKIKTTKPHRYCVRPHSGLVLAGEHVDVSVTLNPKDTPQNLKSRDKFLVQGIPVGEAVSAENIKKLWEDAKAENIIEHKLKVYFSKPSTTDLHTPTFTPTIPAEPSTKHTEHHTDSHLLTSDEDTEMKVPENDVQVEEIGKLRQEKKQMEEQLAQAIAERNEFQRQLKDLQAKLKVLEKERETTLRQRQVVTAQDKPTEKQQMQMQLQQQQQSILANRLVQLLLVAILFYILGRLL